VQFDWLHWFLEHWQAIGSFAGLSTGAAMLTRPRLRLTLFGALGGPEGDAMPTVIYVPKDGPPVATGSIFVRIFLWNYGATSAEDCTVAVDAIWKDDAPAPDHTFLRFPLKWTMADSGPERFAPRKLLPGKANGYRVDVCKVDGVDARLQILSEASHTGSGRHRYDQPGIYTIELIARSSSFWATPARCTLILEYNRSDTEVGLFIRGAGERRHLLRIL
jgi:hypothetical protein